MKGRRLQPRPNDRLVLHKYIINGRRCNAWHTAIRGKRASSKVTAPNNPCCLDYLFRTLGPRGELLEMSRRLLRYRLNLPLISPTYTPILSLFIQGGSNCIYCTQVLFYNDSQWYFSTQLNTCLKIILIIGSFLSQE